MNKERQDVSCVEIEKLIPAFIHREMGHEQLERFMNHIDHCDECREELTIQFLVEVGLESLEAGENFDLQAELDRTLEETYRKINRHQTMRKAFIILQLAGAAAIGLTVLLILIL